MSRVTTASRTTSVNLRMTERLDLTFRFIAGEFVLTVAGTDPDQLHYGCTISLVENDLLDLVHGLTNLVDSNPT